MAPPLISDYKISFALKRLLQTILGGPILIGNNLPLILIILQVFLYILPILELLVVNLLFQYHNEDNIGGGGDNNSDKVREDFHQLKIGYYWKGLIVGISALVIDLVLALVICVFKAIGKGSARKKITPRDSSPPPIPISALSRTNSTHDGGGGDNDNNVSNGNGRPPATTFFAEDDQLDYKGLCHFSTWNFIIPNIYVPLQLHINSIILHLFYVICSSLAFGLCTPLIIDTNLSGFLRGLGLFALCNAKYAAVFHTPFEIAIFDTVEQRKDPLYRTFYTLIIGISYFIASCYSEFTTLKNAFSSVSGTIVGNTCLAILASLPLLWCLGILPPLDALFPWFVETIFHLFGGSVPLYYFGSFLGILVVVGTSILVLITDEYFITSIILQCVLGFVIGCDMGIFPKYCKKSSSTSTICGSEAITFSQCVNKILTPIMQILCSVLFVCLGLILFLKDDYDDEPLIPFEYKMHTELVIIICLLLILAAIKMNQFYALGIGSLKYWNKNSQSLIISQRVLRRMLTAIIHCLLTIELGCSVTNEKLDCGSNMGHSDIFTSWNLDSNDTSLSNSTNFDNNTTMSSSSPHFNGTAIDGIDGSAAVWLSARSHQFKQNTKSLILLCMYSMTIRSFALGVTHPKETIIDILLALWWKYVSFHAKEKYHFPLLLFLVSFPRKWLTRLWGGLGLYLRILYATMSTSLIDTTICTFGLTMLFWPITLITISLGSIIEGATLTSLFTLPIFLLGFPRPSSFWKQSWFPFRFSTSSSSMQLFRSSKTGDNNLDFVIYEDVAEPLVQEFVRKIRECGFALQKGNCFLARFEDRLIFLRVLAIGWNYVYIQMKGLEMQEQTSCHHHEAAWVDELFGSIPYLKRKYELDPIEKSELKSWSFLSYYFRRWYHGRLVTKKELSILNPLFVLTLPTYTESKSAIEPLKTDHEKETLKKMFFFSYTYLWFRTRLSGQQHQHGPILRRDSLICSGTHLFERRSSITSTSSASSWTADDNGPSNSSGVVAKFPYIPGMEQVKESANNTPVPAPTPAPSISINPPPTTAISYTKNRQKNYTQQELGWLQYQVPMLTDNETEIRKIVKITWKIWSMVIGSSSIQDMINNVELYDFFDDGFRTRIEQNLKNFSNAKRMDCMSGEIIVKSFRYAVKLTLDALFGESGGEEQKNETEDNCVVDQIPNGDEWSTQLFNDISIQLAIFERSVQFCSFKEVAEWISKKHPRIITMTKMTERSSSKQITQLRIFNYHDERRNVVSGGDEDDEVRIYVGQLSNSVVDGIWSNLNLELLYLTSDDDERYSIQHDKILLRNICTQCANSPLGYSVYDSTFRLNLLDQSKIQQIQ